MVGLGLLDDVEVLGLAGAHSHLGDIDVAVALGNHTEVFLADLLTRGGKLGDSTRGSGLRALSAGVGVHLGVDDDDVDVLAAGQHVVQTAESDIVAPTVAAEDPLALLDRLVIGDTHKLSPTSKSGRYADGIVERISAIFCLSPITKWWSTRRFSTNSLQFTRLQILPTPAVKDR